MGEFFRFRSVDGRGDSMGAFLSRLRGRRVQASVAATVALITVRQQLQVPADGATSTSRSIVFCGPASTAASWISPRAPGAFICTRAMPRRNRARTLLVSNSCSTFVQATLLGDYVCTKSCTMSKLLQIASFGDEDHALPYEKLLTKSSFLL